MIEVTDWKSCPVGCCGNQGHHELDGAQPLRPRGQPAGRGEDGGVPLRHAAPPQISKAGQPPHRRVHEGFLKGEPRQGVRLIYSLDHPSWGTKKISELKWSASW